VRAIAQHRLGVFGKLRAFPSIDISADLSVVALWSALGLTLAALFCSLGFGLELGELLGRAE
jgi:hypothetical protein